MNRTDYTHEPTRELSPRQREVWDLIAEGLCTKSIARRLGIAEGSVRIHTRELFLKIGAGSRLEAAVKWYRRAA